MHLHREIWECACSCLWNAEISRKEIILKNACDDNAGNLFDLPYSPLFGIQLLYSVSLLNISLSVLENIYPCLTIIIHYFWKDTLFVSMRLLLGIFFSQTHLSACTEFLTNVFRAEFFKSSLYSFSFHGTCNSFLLCANCWCPEINNSLAQELFVCHIAAFLFLSIYHPVHLYLQKASAMQLSSAPALWEQLVTMAVIRIRISIIIHCCWWRFFYC